MGLAYIDTSLLIGLWFEETTDSARQVVKKYDRLYSSEILIAEMLAFGKRGKIHEESLLAVLTGITWVIPERSLLDEIRNILQYGYIRGADAWHLACACYLAPNRNEIAFLTRDSRQREIATLLGFQVPEFS